MLIRSFLVKIFTLLIVLIPLIVWQGYYEGPKIFWFWGVSLVLILFWLIRILFYKSIKLIKPDYWYLGWLITLIISSLFGIHPLESIIGGSYRHQGAIFFLGLWLAIKTHGLLNDKEKEFFKKSLTAVIFLETIIVLLQYSFGILYFGSPLGTIGESNALGGFIAMGMFLVFKFANNILFAIPAIAILMTESRSALISFIPNMFLLFSGMGKMLKTILLTSIATFLITFVLSVTPFADSSVVENRGRIWQYGLEQVLNRPLMGYGAESGEVVFNEVFKRHGIELDGVNIDRSHNLFLDIMLWSGIFGLITFCGFLISLFITIKKTSGKYLLVSFLIYSMFQPLSLVHFLYLIIL